MTPRAIAIVVVAISACLLASCGRIQVQPAGPPIQSPLLQGDHARMADGYRLPLRVWEPEASPAAVVLGVHGFGDYGNAFAVLAGTLVDPGFAVIYAYDQRGFGATQRPGIWPGSDTLVSDLRTMVSLLRQRHPEQRLVLIAESMGGAVVLRALNESPALDIDGAALLAPAVWGPETQSWYQRLALWVLLRVAPGATLSGDNVADLGIRPTDDREVMRALSRDPLVQKRARIDTLDGVARLMGEALSHPYELHGSVLVLYGLLDQVIPPGPVCAWLKRLEAEAGDFLPRVVLYTGGYHMLTRYLGAGDTLADLAVWVQDPAAPLPAGEELELVEAAARVCGLPPRGRRRDR